jgi:uncharacterized protein YcbK (DUF882 family)
MITLQELNPHNYTLTDEQKANQAILLVCINKVRAAWGKPMVVTSGVRCMADQMKINPSAPKSKHLIGAAVDIADKDGELYKWCKANEKILEDAEVYCEEGTKGWVHFQCIAPKSGRRWFYP